MIKDKNRLEIQGHRGDRSLFLENTLLSFASAIEAGVDAIELDLHVTKDQNVVIYHDYFLKNRRSSPICSLSLAEIKKENGQIPTLDELFNLIHHSKEKKVRLNLEIKRDPRHPEWSAPLEDLVFQIVSKVQKQGFEEKVYYSSFDPEVLMQVRKLDKKTTLALVFASRSKENEPFFIQQCAIAASCNATILSPQYDLLTNPSIVLSLQEKGFRVITWTVNKTKDWEKCIEMGVDGIITDRPRDLIAFLKGDHK